jgi:hypothetical protein
LEGKFNSIVSYAKGYRFLSFSFVNMGDGSSDGDDSITQPVHWAEEADIFLWIPLKTGLFPPLPAQWKSYWLSQ